MISLQYSHNRKEICPDCGLKLYPCKRGVFSLLCTICTLMEGEKPRYSPHAFRVAVTGTCYPTSVSWSFIITQVRTTRPFYERNDLRNMCKNFLGICYLNDKPWWAYQKQRIANDNERATHTTNLLQMTNQTLRYSVLVSEVGNSASVASFPALKLLGTVVL